MGIVVSETMVAKDSEISIEPNYLVIKIGEKVFSTKFGYPKINFKVCKLQESNTKNIGRESNLYLTGVFVETNKHTSIDPIPFEINFYSKIDSLLPKLFNSGEWNKLVCEACKEGHLYCENCKKYVWRKENV